METWAPSGPDDAPPTSRSAVAPSARTRLLELLDALSELAKSAAASETATASEHIAIFRASVAPIKLLGQLTGELGASEVTIATSAHYRRIRLAIVDALRPYPEAAKAVLAALEREESPAAEVAA